MHQADTRSNLLSIRQFMQSVDDHGDWPVIGDVSFVAETNTVEMKLSVPADLACFAGHFPSQAVLPGIVQIHWAGEFAKHVFNMNSFTTLQGSKFNSMVLPQAELCLQLKCDANKHSVKFVYYDDTTKYSMGTLIFQGAESA